MKTPAAVLIELNRPLVLTELELPALGRGQVLVETLFSGLCDAPLLMSCAQGGPNDFLPRVFGHEGYGRVADVGAGVSRVKPGQEVVVSWLKGAGLEGAPVEYRWEGRALRAGPAATFLKRTIVSENRLFPATAAKVPAKAAALLGCPAALGFGLIFNTLDAEHGKSLAVFGMTGEALCAVAAAKAAGLRRIVAVDARRDRLDAALLMGATEVFSSGEGVPIELLGLEPGGFDYAIEATSSGIGLRQAIECARPRGGTVAVAENGRFGAKPALDGAARDGRRLLGFWDGDHRPDRDFPIYEKLLADGRVNLEPLTRATYPLARVNAAIDDMTSGAALRPMLEL